jgi:hypothetical protein
VPRIDLPTLRAALWTAVAVQRTRASLRRNGLAGTRVAPPPALPSSARRGVTGLLRRTRATCLERALVLQCWEAAHGAPGDIVIGVTAPNATTGGFRAHAWLETMPDALAVDFHEIRRLPAP